MVVGCCQSATVDPVESFYFIYEHEELKRT